MATYRYNPTRLEASSRGVVLAYCVECTSWRRMVATRADALREQAAHIELVHERPKLAANMRDRARKLDTPS